MARGRGWPAAGSWALAEKVRVLATVLDKVVIAAVNVGGSCSEMLAEAACELLELPRFLAFGHQTTSPGSLEACLK